MQTESRLAEDFGKRRQPMGVRVLPPAVFHINISVEIGKVVTVFGNAPVCGFHRVGFKPVVGIAEHDVFPRCFFQPQIPRPARSGVAVRRKKLHPAVARRILFQNFSRTVSRRIIDANGLNVCHRLAEEAVQTFRQIFFDVVDRNNHRYGG